MRRIGEVIVEARELLPSRAGIVAVAAVVAFGLAVAARSLAQERDRSLTQNIASTALTYTYEVVSVKPTKPGSSGGYTMNTPDGYRAANTSLKTLIDYAYGIFDSERLSGAPNWISSERYDVDAKMDGAVADALQKMSKDDRTTARQQMLQALLADRFKLIVRRETRELSIYTLVIAKNGPKLREAKLDDKSPDIIRGADGHPVTNVVRNGLSAGGVTMTGQAVTIPYLARQLSQQLGRIVVDQTGLIGNFDFKMEFTPEQGGLQVAPSDTPGGTSPLPLSDPMAPSLFTAVQEQLGLKLESGKGPIEIIVIDHLERPSGN